MDDNSCGNDRGRKSRQRTQAHLLKNTRKCCIFPGRSERRTTKVAGLTPTHHNWKFASRRFTVGGIFFMTIKPNRGSFLAGSAAAFASVAIVRSPAHAAALFTWKSGTNQTKEHPLSVAMINMADAIRTETAGRLDIQVFPNNQ